MSDFLKATSLALDILLHDLERYGNRPSQKQKDALHEILSCYTRMADGSLKGRYAFPLATGLGKTQSIVAWVTALHHLGIEDVGMAVGAGKVEALCDLKRDLIRHGVPEERIGLVHSYAHDPSRLTLPGELPPGYASLPCTQDNETRQFLLVTHNRVRGTGDLLPFNGRSRGLLIWDESLIVSDARHLELFAIRSCLGALSPYVDLIHPSRAVLLDLLGFMNGAVALLGAELQAQREQGREPERIRLPELSTEAIRTFKGTLAEYGRKTRVDTSTLSSFLDFSQRDIRVAATPQNGGIITYDVMVLKELGNIVILDASHPIRELVHLDKSIQVQGRHCQDPIVSYENVTIHLLKAPSGRDSMTKSFRQRRRENRKVSQEVAEVVKDIPEDEAVLIFTFKARQGVDFVRTLRDDLHAHDIDTKAKLPSGQDRFVFLTWGNETSLSQFSYCSNVIFAGVLHRSEVDIAAAMAGQKDDLLTDLPHSHVLSVLRSEVAHSLYQAMCRGSCRVVQGEKTRPMNVWLIHKDESIKDVLETVMPGVRWSPWKGQHLNPNTKEERLAQSIRDYLDSLGPEVETVSTQKVKKTLDLEDEPKRTMVRACKLAVEGSHTWTMEGRSFVRTDARSYGFTAECVNF